MLSFFIYESDAEFRAAGAVQAVIAAIFFITVIYLMTCGFN